MRVLVTGSSMFFAARLIQGFTAAGVSVTAADSHWWSVGKAITPTKWLRTPSLSRNPAGYLSALVQELKARPYDLLLPTFEESLLLSEFRDAVEPLTNLLLSPFSVMWQLHHKPSLYRLCSQLGIPTPPTVTHLNPLHLEQQVRSLQFPVVLKLPNGNNSIGREFCDTMPALVNRFHALYSREILRHAEPPFVQQKIEGQPIYTLMLCHDGRKLGEVIYRPLRSFPEDGGTSSHRESIHHPRIAELTTRLAAATRWSGFLGLDFIADRTDGTPYLIDANPRANPAVQLGYLAGVDWTSLLLDIERGVAPAPMTAQVGVRNRTPLLDALWVLDGLRPQRNWARNLSHRVRSVVKPDWNLDSGHDFVGRREWLCHLALGWQSFAAMGHALLTGQTLGQSFTNGVNYDPVTVQSLRKAAGMPAGDPSRVAHAEKHGMQSPLGLESL